MRTRVQNVEQLYHLSQSLETAELPFSRYMDKEKRVGLEEQRMHYAGHESTVIREQALVRFNLNLYSSPSVLSEPRAGRTVVVTEPAAPTVTCPDNVVMFYDGPVPRCEESTLVLPFANVQLLDTASTSSKGSLPPTFLFRVECQQGGNAGYFSPNQDATSAPITRWNTLGNESYRVVTVVDLYNDETEVSMDTAQSMLRGLPFEVAPIILPSMDEVIRHAGRRFHQSRVDMEELMADLLLQPAERRMIHFTLRFGRKLITNSGDKKKATFQPIAGIHVGLQVLPGPRTCPSIKVFRHTTVLSHSLVELLLLCVQCGPFLAVFYCWASRLWLASISGR